MGESPWGLCVLGPWDALGSHCQAWLTGGLTVRCGLGRASEADSSGERGPLPPPRGRADTLRPRGPEIRRWLGDCPRAPELVDPAEVLGMERAGGPAASAGPSCSPGLSPPQQVHPRGQGGAG